MLRDSRELVLKEPSYSGYFQHYKNLVTEFCDYLAKTEGIQAKAFSSLDEEKELQNIFESLPVAEQAAKFDNFLNYYNHCFELANGQTSLTDKKQSLQSFCYLYGLRIPSQDEIFSLLGPNVYVEIYGVDFSQRYRTPNWLETTSYSMMALETMDWRNLFIRSEHVLQGQMEVITALYSEKVKQPVYRPIEIHTVKELKSKSPLCAEIESLAYAPVYDKEGNFAGVLHVVCVNNLRSIAFSVCDETTTLH